MASPSFNVGRFLLMLKTMKRWWVAVLLLVIVGGNVGGLLLPSKYEAQAFVAIHEPKIETISQLSNQVLNVEDRLKNIREELTSPDFLKVIAARENLDAGIQPDTPQYQKLLQNMAAAITLTVKEQAHFAISYLASSPEQAQHVTRAIVDQFIKVSDDYYNSKATSLVSLVDDQLKDAKAQLKVSQEAVSKYENEHYNEIPSALERHVKRLSELGTQKQADIIGLQVVQEKLDLANKMLETMDPNATVVRGPDGQASSVEKLIQEKQALEVKANLLLKDFTPAHPQVVDVRAQIAELDRLILETQKTKDNAPALPKSDRTAIPNKEYAQLHSQISAYQIEETRLKGKVDEDTRQIGEIERYVNNIPQYKTPLDQLENDRRLKEDQVNQLTRKVSEARMTIAIEQRGMGPSFEIQQYPLLPQIATWPNRQKIFILSVGMALIATLGLLYLMTVFDSAVRSVDEARDILKMPILGMVQRIITPAEELMMRQRRRRQFLSVGMAMTIIIVVLVVGLTLYRDSLEHSLETMRNYIKW